MNDEFNNDMPSAPPTGATGAGSPPPTVSAASAQSTAVPVELQDPSSTSGALPQWMGLALGAVAIAVISFFVGYAVQPNSASATNGRDVRGNFPGGFQGGGQNRFGPPGMGGNGAAQNGNGFAPPTLGGNSNSKNGNGFAPPTLGGRN